MSTSADNSDRTAFKTLGETRLGITDDDLRKAFSPFVERTVDGKDAEWSEQLQRRQKKIAVKYGRRLLFGWLPRVQRREESIVEEYSKVWGESDYTRYSLEEKPPRFSPWEWRGDRMLASTIGATRFRQLMFVRLIEKLKPRSVLEVGCGNGINLLLLAGRFPEIEFTGVELTQAGHEAAKSLQELEELPDFLQRFAPLPLRDTTAFRRIKFLQGNATRLPFKAGTIDLVMTVLALEQMERVRQQALSEVARVAGRHTFMIEPFRDVNAKGWTRMNVLRRNYFRGRIADLRAHALEPVLVTDDFPQETFLHAAAVLCEKNSAAALIAGAGS